MPYLPIKEGFANVTFNAHQLHPVMLGVKARGLHVQVEAELKALEARPGTAEVLVVGTGYAGIELATTVAERLGSRGQVRMVTAGRCPLPHPQAMRSARRPGRGAWGPTPHLLFNRRMDFPLFHR